jgi:hypothetical protein
MPVWKHSITGQEAELTSDYVSVFAEGTWTKVADEGPVERSDRELREAIANKVEIEEAEPVELPAAEVDEKLLEAERKARITLNEAGGVPEGAAPKKTTAKKKAGDTPVAHVSEHAAPTEGEGQ